MKILDRLDISGSLNLSSIAKDTFIIGTPLENNDGNVDNLYVHANADFKNNVILGSSSVDIITVSGNLVINPVATPPTSREGQIYYDSVERVLVSDTELPTVHTHLGRSLMIRAKNTDSVTLTKGMAVRIGTPQGANKTFARALSVNIPLTGAVGNQIIGVINEDIAVNSFGYATTVGEIDGLNTNAFIEGDQVYVSNTVSGSLTGSRPTAPYEVIQIGTCIYKHPTQGKIFVKTRDPVHFGDITGFNPDVTNLRDGQVIRYQSSDGTWGNSNSGVKLTGSFSGSLSIPLAANVVGFNAGANKVSLNNNNSQIFDDGNLHVHGSGSVWINSQNDNPIRLNEQSSGSVVAGNNFFMNSGYGSSALAFGVRSWVNFDGTGATGAKTPRGSGNVASVTKNSTGNYTVTFSYPMPDANYCLQATCKNDAAADSDLAINIHYNTTPSTGSFTIQTARYGSGPVDSSYIMVCVIR